MMFEDVMDENRNYVTAVTVSLFLHLFIFVQFMNNGLNSSAQAPEYAPRMNVNLLPPPVKKPQLIKPETPPVKSKPKPKPKKIHKPKPTIKPVAKPEPRPEPAPAVVQERAVAPRVAPVVQRETENRTRIVKEHYLSNLLTYIEGHKYYPRAARHRGIEGSINVSFQLLNNGNISGLKTNGGPLILRKAAEQAIAKALPFPTPPTEVDCPLQVSYAMQFHLN